MPFQPSTHLCRAQPGTGVRTNSVGMDFEEGEIGPKGYAESLEEKAGGMEGLLLVATWDVGGKDISKNTECCHLQYRQELREG